MDFLEDMVANYVRNDGKYRHTKLFMVFAGPLLTTIVFLALEEVGLVPKNWFSKVGIPRWAFRLIAGLGTPLILISLARNQRLELGGAYGETILLLIPTFIWLLPGHPGAIKLMLYTSAVVLGLGFTLYIGSIIFIRITRAKEPDAEVVRTSRRIRKSLVCFRISFVSTSIASTLMVSIILIVWADFSEGWSTVNNAITNKLEIDYTSSAWIAFIAGSTICVSLVLVMLGLIRGFSSNYRDINKKTFKDTIKALWAAFVNKRQKDFVSEKFKTKRKKKRKVRRWDR